MQRWTEVEKYIIFFLSQNLLYWLKECEHGNVIWESGHPVYPIQYFFSS